MSETQGIWDRVGRNFIRLTRQHSGEWRAELGDASVGFSNDRFTQPEALFALSMKLRQVNWVCSHDEIPDSIACELPAGTIGVLIRSRPGGWRAQIVEAPYLGEWTVGGEPWRAVVFLAITMIERDIVLYPQKPQPVPG